MTILITGANRGLGLATALALAADPQNNILLAGRDPQGLTAAQEQITAQTGNQQIATLPLDLASLDDVRSAVTTFKTMDLPPLQTIIANAGISRPDITARSADGYELTFAVNHLGHFLLINLLLEGLQTPARILNLTSSTHDMQKASGPMSPARYVKGEWLAYPEKDPEYAAGSDGAGGQAYTTSKLCNILFTYELDRRLKAAGLSTAEHPITVNAACPGFVPGTDLGRDEKGMMRFMWYQVFPRIGRFLPFITTQEDSAAKLASLATAPEYAAVSGKYFSSGEMIDSSADSYDENKAADLWQTSVQLSGLQPGESPLIDGDPSEV